MASYPGVTAGRDDIAIVEDGEVLTSLRPGANGLAKRWANARLIAVAPDLLALANDIVSNVILAGTEIGQRAQELIAKATGAAP
jgi:hypothetical protein